MHRVHLGLINHDIGRPRCGDHTHPTRIEAIFFRFPIDRDVFWIEQAFAEELAIVHQLIAFLGADLRMCPVSGIVLEPGRRDAECGVQVAVEFFKASARCRSVGVVFSIAIEVSVPEWR